MKRTIVIILIVFSLLSVGCSQSRQILCIAEPRCPVFGESAAAVPGVSSKKYYRTGNLGADRQTIPADVIVISEIDDPKYATNGNHEIVMKVFPEPEEAIAYFRENPLGEKESRNRIVIVIHHESSAFALDNAWSDEIKKTYGATIYTIGAVQENDWEKKDLLRMISSNNGVYQNPSYCFYCEEKNIMIYLRSILSTVEGLTMDRLSF